MSGLGAGIPGGSLTDNVLDKTKQKVFGDDRPDRDKKRRRLQASPMTAGFAPPPNPLAVNQRTT